MLLDCDIHRLNLDVEHRIQQEQHGTPAACLTACLQAPPYHWAQPSTSSMGLQPPPYYYGPGMRRVAKDVERRKTSQPVHNMREGNKMASAWKLPSSGTLGRLVLVCTTIRGLVTP